MGVAFPLQRLHTLIANGIWSDQESKLLWENTYDTPYQLWSADPASGAKLQLQNVSFPCPWCNHIGEISLIDFTQTHVLKTGLSQCGLCRHQFDADKLSAEYLKQDLAEFIDTIDPR